MQSLPGPGSLAERFVGSAEGTIAGADCSGIEIYLEIRSSLLMFRVGSCERSIR
jgi:hypothetical protein